MNKFYAVDLFSGAGGFSEGILQAGFHILVASDINPMAAKTYINRHNQLGYVDGHNTKFITKSISDLTGSEILNAIQSLSDNHLRNIQEIDAFFGGPPCQGFSRAGKRKENDPRNFLFKEYIRVVSEIKPKYVVMENVEGFIDTKLSDFQGLSRKYSGKKLLTELLQLEFNDIGYKLKEFKILNAADFGVPQERKRVIFIAYKNDVTEPNYPRPTVDKRITFKEAIYDLYDENYSSDYSKSISVGNTKNIFGESVGYDKLQNRAYSRHTPLVLDRFKLFKDGENVSRIRNRIQNEGIDLRNTIFEEKFDSETIARFANCNVSEDEINLLLTCKKNRIKLATSKPSKTIMTIADDYINPFSNKVLTVREMARLQSFDDSFEFLGKRTTGGKNRTLETPQQTQVGNAVPPLLAKAIATEIYKALYSKVK